MSDASERSIEALEERVRLLYSRYDPRTTMSEAEKGMREAEVRRHAEQASWIEGAASVLDIGGGFGPFGVLLAELGARTVILDRFSHPTLENDTEHRRIAVEAGAQLLDHDAVSGEPLPFPDGSFDAVTSFDSMEHWHHSPRGLFSEVVRVSAPGARFILGVPNAVNLRKRVTVPLGRSNWSRFEDWYYEPTFHGHVREPTVSDLALVAQDMRLASWKIVGRNWLGFRGSRRRQLLARALDRPLRLRPSLCSTIYLIGETGRAE